MELWQELNIKTQQLDQALKTLRQNGINFAQAERDYKITLRQEVLKLRDEGMAVTMIPLVVYGIDEVAKKRFERDCCESVYEANKEAINVKKLELRIIQEQFNKEYNNER